MQAGETIEKPWGSEFVVDLCGAYCIKHLRVRRGHRLSLQYHERKRETLMLISGEAALTLAEGGAYRETPMRRGEACVIEPGVVHRVAGVSEEDAVILEVSTTELDDVTRLQDDYGR